MGIILIPITAAFHWLVVRKSGRIGICSLLALAYFLVGGLFNSAFLLLLFLAYIIFAFTGHWIPKEKHVFVVNVLVIIALCFFAFLISKRMYRAGNLKQQNEFVSLRDRVPTVAKPYTTQASFDYRDHTFYYEYNFRNYSIARMHYSTVAQFMIAPEFGVGRMLTDDFKTLELKEQPIRMDQSSDCDGAGIEVGTSPQQSTLEELSFDHVKLASWFTERNRRGWGDDIDHVAGFLPHAVVTTSESYKRNWFSTFRIPSFSLNDADTESDAVPYVATRIQLISLLLHERPVAYVHDTLPNMQDVRNTPTRELDEFEKRGIDAIQKESFLYSEQNGPTIRAVGALINAESCSMCHQGPKNQILGAFSYVLTEQ